MAFTGKFVCMAHHFILLRLNPFDLRVDKERWWFEHSLSQLRVCLSAEGAKNLSWPWLSPLRGWGSLTMTSTGKFVYIYIYIKQQLAVAIIVFHYFISVVLWLLICKVCNFARKRLQHSCLPVKFAKFSRTPILKNICERLALEFQGYF